MKLVDKNFKPEAAEEFLLEFEAEALGYLQGMIDAMGIAPGHPKFFDVAKEAVHGFKRFNAKTEKMELKWTRAQVQSVLHTMVNFVNASTLFLKQYAENEKHGDVVRMKKDCDDVLAMFRDLERVVKQKGFVELEDEEFNRLIGAKKGKKK